MWADFRHTDNKTQTEVVGTIKTGICAQLTEAHYNQMSDRAENTAVQTVTSKEQCTSPAREKEEAIFLSHTLM